MMREDAIGVGYRVKPRDRRTVLVTGGTGVLGRQLRPRLEEAGYEVRTMSRRGPGPRPVDASRWAVADLATGAGLREALRDVSTVVHAATSPFRRTRSVDVAGTGRLLDACEREGVEHLLYVSIVGIERIPYPYFRHKVSAERKIERSGVAWSILRATQFHELLDMQIGWAARLPLLIFPDDLRFQLLDSGEAAEWVVRGVDAGPSGRLRDIGGPVVQTSGELVRAWLAARGERRRVIDPPTPGKLFAAYRAAYNCVPENPVGSIRWETWLAAQYGGRASEEAMSGSGTR